MYQIRAISLLKKQDIFRSMVGWR